MTVQANVRIERVASEGFWLKLGSEVLFVPFAGFPWFKDVLIAKLANVKRPQPHHLHWPDLDIDLAVESIRDPKKFPLIAKHR